MNDTETEAHRLLAAATEDTPPEIDLLDGFATARRRDRSRRTRRGAVLSAGIAVAAASVTAVTLTMGSAPPALATVTSALTRTLTQSYHLSEQDSYLHHEACTTEADPARHLLATSCAGQNGPFVREVGGYIYYYNSPTIFPQPKYSNGKLWLRIPSASVLQLPGTDSFSAATPQQMLALIKELSKVTAAGPASGPGWTGTRYAFSATLKSGTKLSGTMTVDRQGRARALVLTTRFPSDPRTLVMTNSLTFSDFGAPVTVTPPPADQTFSGP
jgi:hypothetical protein